MYQFNKFSVYIPCSNLFLFIPKYAYKFEQKRLSKFATNTDVLLRLTIWNFKHYACRRVIIIQLWYIFKVYHKSSQKRCEKDQHEWQDMWAVWREWKFKGKRCTTIPAYQPNSRLKLETCWRNRGGKHNKCHSTNNHKCRPLEVPPVTHNLAFLSSHHVPLL